MKSETKGASGLKTNVGQPAFVQKGKSEKGPKQTLTHVAKTSLNIDPLPCCCLQPPSAPPGVLHLFRFMLLPLPCQSAEPQFCSPSQQTRTHSKMGKGELLWTYDMIVTRCDKKSLQDLLLLAPGPPGPPGPGPRGRSSIRSCLLNSS